MSRPLGGYIGHRPTPAASGRNSVAGGMWTLAEAQRLKQGGAWPAAPLQQPTFSTSPSLWLDASLSDTLFNQTTGGTGVASGGLVARWEDKSGNSRHATQATSGNRPTWVTSSANSKPAVRFDGTNDFLVGTHGTGANSPHTLLVALRITTPANTGDRSAITLGVPDNTQAAFYGIPFRYSLSNYGLRSPFRDRVVDPAVSWSSTPFLAYSARISADNTRFGIGSNFYSDTSIMPLSLAAQLEIGRSGDASFTAMDVYEVIICPFVMTDAEVTGVLGYWTDKWGTP